MRLKEFGYIPTDATVINCTLSQKAGRYFISVLCDVEKSKAEYKSETDGIGVDLGLKEFAVCSNHLVFETINKQERIIKMEKRLKRQQRKLSRSYEQNKNRKRGEFCAKNRQKQLLVVQKLHARLANSQKRVYSICRECTGENQTSIYRHRRFKRQRHDEKPPFIPRNWTTKLQAVQRVAHRKVFRNRN